MWKKELGGCNLKTEEISKKSVEFSRKLYPCPYCDVVLGFASVG